MRLKWSKVSDVGNFQEICMKLMNSALEAADILEKDDATAVLASIIRKARLFDFTDVPIVEYIPTAEELPHELKMPFPEIAIQYDKDVMSILTPIDSVLEYAGNVDTNLFDASTLHRHDDNSFFVTHFRTFDDDYTIPYDASIVCGVLTLSEEERGAIPLFDVALAGNRIAYVKEYTQEDTIADVMRSLAYLSCKAVLYLNDPDNWIVSRQEEVNKKRKRNKKRNKNKYRLPVYTALKAHEARKYAGISEPAPRTEGGKVVAERRGHYRRGHTWIPKSTRYGDKVGKVLYRKGSWVKPVWNGKSTNVKDGHYYKILMDLNDAPTE